MLRVAVRGMVSTIEAIAAALRFIEGEPPAAERERLCALMIAGATVARSNRRNPRG